MRLMANDEKALDMYFSSFIDDEEGDEDYVPFEEWKQVLTQRVREKEEGLQTGTHGAIGPVRGGGGRGGKVVEWK